MGLLRRCEDKESVGSWEQFRTGAPLPHFSFHPNQPVDREQPGFDMVTEEVVSSLCPYLSHTRSAHAQSYPRFLRQPSVEAAKVEAGSFTFFMGLKIRNYICLD